MTTPTFRHAASRRAAAPLILPSALLLVALSGCTVGPDYTPPQTTVSPAWSTPLSGGEVADTADLQRWWTTLNDPALDALVTRAVEGNLDLKVATSRIREARAQRGVVAADGLPQIDATGSYSRSRQSENAGFRSNGGGGGGNSSNQSSSGGDLYSVGFDASWEIDVFGRIKRNVEASDADIESFIESRRDVLVSLLAEVALNYVEARAFQSRLEIAQRNIRVQTDTVDVAAARAKAGLRSELDVAQAKANLASTQATIPPLLAGLKAAQHRLAVLIGKQPGELAGAFDSVTGIPQSPDRVPVGLPSDLLRRRPDIRRAERALAAATARIGVATADLFPRFSITGQFGLESTQFGSLFNGDSRFWSIGPSMRWPIFQGGRLRSNIEVQNAREEQASAQYEKAVLTSLEDTENALVNFSREQERRVKLREAVAANQTAVDLSNALYSKGLTDFQAVLDSQRQLFQTEEALVLSERTVTQNLISLYKALGGGWEAFEPVKNTATATAAPEPATGNGFQAPSN